MFRLVLAALLGDALPEMATSTLVHPQGAQNQHCPQASMKLNPRQKFQELSTGLTSKYCPGQMFHSFSVQMGAGVSNMARPLFGKNIVRF